MGNTVSRCGNRVQEFITCSRNAKPDEKNGSPNSEPKSSPGDRKAHKKSKSAKQSKEQSRKPEVVIQAEISVTPEEEKVSTAVEADQKTGKDIQADQKTGKDIQADQTRGEDIKADQTTEDNKADQTNGEDIKADQTNGENIKADQTRREDIKADQTNGENIQAEEQNIEDGGLSDIERRQEAILQRLSGLSQEIQQLARESGVPLVSPPTSTAHSLNTHTTSNKPGVIKDLVVSADPDKPPLSLFICLHLLQQQHKVLASVHVHSSVREIDPKLKEMFQNGPQVPRSDCEFALTVVWKKEDKSPSLMVDPHRQVPIVGEANIARYLARLLTPVYDSGDILEATLIDNWLDTATHQLLNGNSKEKAAAMRNLNSRLGKNDWLASSSMSLADVVTWSAVFQSGLAENAPANVQKWFKSCSNLRAFQLDQCLFR